MQNLDIQEEESLNLQSLGQINNQEFDLNSEMELQELVVVPIVRAGLTAVKYAPAVIEGA